MSDAANGGSADRLLGAHGEAITALKGEVAGLRGDLTTLGDDLRKEIEELKLMMAGARGGLRVLLSLTAAVGVVTGLFIEAWHWIFHH